MSNEPWDPSVGILVPRAQSRRAGRQPIAIKHLFAAAMPEDAANVRPGRLAPRWVAYSIEVLAQRVLSCCDTSGECANVQLYVDGKATNDDDETELAFQAALVALTDRRGAPIARSVSQPLRTYAVVDAEGVFLGEYEGTSADDALDAYAVDSGYHGQADAMQRGMAPFVGTLTLLEAIVDHRARQGRHTVVNVDLRLPESHDAEPVVAFLRVAAKAIACSWGSNALSGSIKHPVTGGDMGRWTIAFE